MPAFSYAWASSHITSLSSGRVLLMIHSVLLQTTDCFPSGYLPIAALKHLRKVLKCGFWVLSIEEIPQFRYQKAKIQRLQKEY